MLVFFVVHPPVRREPHERRDVWAKTVGPAGAVRRENVPAAAISKAPTSKLYEAGKRSSGRFRRVTAAAGVTTGTLRTGTRSPRQG